jgi:hypothetical protein
MYGMSVNKKMIPGKKAIKKENAMAEARVVIEPSTILLQKKIATLYKGTPSKKGRDTFFARSIIHSPNCLIFLYVNTPFSIRIIIVFQS